MSWVLVDQFNDGSSEFVLYTDASHYMIRVNGYELMNSKNRVSEERMADIAFDLAPTTKKILIAGLGIGFSLWAFEKAFLNSEIHVVEKSQTIYEWYKKYFEKAFISNPSQASFFIADAWDHIQQNKKYDLIVLDVDNGPEALAAESNERIYSLKGLEALKASLTENGKILLWSSFRSSEFESKCQRASLRCEAMDIQISDNKRLIHTIYVLN